MDLSATEEKAAPTKAISRKPHSKPSTLPVILALGNPIVTALIGELEALGYPFELVNMEIDGSWIAHLRLKGQMWSDTGNLQESVAVDDDA